ncbi:hypothetical protein [Rhodopila sp.]|uniref:hypothetical protein n=1 Tax=Rhodopila sp. TaxID=2480087 RepID=UPI003D103F29
MSAHTPRGTKLSDYSLFHGKVIVEHKAYLDSPEQQRKGQVLNAFFESLIFKYKIAREQIPSFRERLNPEERKKLQKLTDTFLHKLQNKIAECKDQIRDTKKILELPSAVGVALITFDRVRWMIPGVVAQRSWRSLPKLRHVDFAIAAIRTPDRGRVSIQYMGSANLDPKHQAILRGVLDVMGAGTPRKRYDLYTAMEMEWEGKL